MKRWCKGQSTQRPRRAQDPALWSENRMHVAPGATARPTTLCQRCRPKAPRTLPAPRNLSQKIQSQRRHVVIRRSRLRRRIKRKRRKNSGTRGGSTLVSKPRPLESTPRPQRRSSRPDALTIIRKATMQMSAPNLQKTSVGLGNLRASD